MLFFVCLFFCLFFSVRLLSVLRGQLVFSSAPQRPMTSDFEMLIWACINYLFSGSTTYTVFLYLKTILLCIRITIAFYCVYMHDARTIHCVSVSQFRCLYMLYRACAPCLYCSLCWSMYILVHCFDTNILYHF